MYVFVLMIGPHGARSLFQHIHDRKVFEEPKTFMGLPKRSRIYRPVVETLSFCHVSEASGLMPDKIHAWLPIVTQVPSSCQRSSSKMSWPNCKRSGLDLEMTERLQ